MTPLSLGNIILLKEKVGMRESFLRQVDKKSRGPQGERVLEFSRKKKGQTFFSPLHSLRLYNIEDTFLLPEKLLTNLVILKCISWVWV